MFFSEIISCTQWHISSNELRRNLVLADSLSLLLFLFDCSSEPEVEDDYGFDRSDRPAGFLVSKSSSAFPKPAFFFYIHRFPGLLWICILAWHNPIPTVFKQMFSRISSSHLALRDNIGISSWWPQLQWSYSYVSLFCYLNWIRSCSLYIPHLLPWLQSPMSQSHLAGLFIPNNYLPVLGRSPFWISVFLSIAIRGNTFCFGTALLIAQSWCI
jgi:hypothetical protein